MGVFLKESSYIFRTVLSDKVFIFFDYFSHLNLEFIIGKSKQIVEQKMN